MNSRSNKKPLKHSNKKKLGDKGEDLAAAWLEKQGFRILDRNYHASHAEIDIICEDIAGNGDLVFVEVKTRRSRSHGSAIEAISGAKLNLVKRAAGYYLFVHGIEDRMCRFDVIGIQLTAGIPEFEHLRDVLEY